MGALVLTDLQVRKAKPAERDYKLADSGGLYLFVTRKCAKCAPPAHYFKDAGADVQTPTKF